MKLALFLVLVCANGTNGFGITPNKVRNDVQSKLRQSDHDYAFDPLGLSSKAVSKAELKAPLALAPMLTLLSCAPAANAMEFPDAIPSALTAYAHYLGLVLVCLSLAFERALVKPGMSEEDEKTLGNADIVYGIAGVIVLVSGYFRVTEFGKGWEFYSHSPVFWVKMTLFSIMGSASLFNTIKIIQRAIPMSKGDIVPPMSVKLASRMTKIINGELLAICSIPLTAALMARGVGYSDWFPWQAGAAPVALAVGGLGFKYVKEALDWTEDEASEEAIASSNE